MPPSQIIQERFGRFAGFFAHPIDCHFVTERLRKLPEGCLRFSCRAPSKHHPCTAAHLHRRLQLRLHSCRKDTSCFVCVPGYRCGRMTSMNASTNDSQIALPLTCVPGAYLRVKITGLPSSCCARGFLLPRQAHGGPQISASGGLPHGPEHRARTLSTCPPLGPKDGLPCQHQHESS